MRALILLHRYLGIAIGLVMAMWCASGFVMMYVAYPSLDNEARLRALAPISLQDCCAYDKIASQLGVDVVDSFHVEMAAGRPVLQVAMSQGRRHTFDLRSGEHVESFDQLQAMAVASRHAQALQVTGTRQYLEAVERDQWTVSGQFNRDRPLQRIALGDPDGTELYVSSATGQVVQHTTSSQRFWNWLGAVPHWLYPTALRQHDQLWSQVMIWLSLAGMFLTTIGLYIGVAHWRAMRGAKLSPYRGVTLWHHLSGLFFGVLALTWVGSGWVSMSPWGLFEGGGFRQERDRVRDAWIDGGQISTTLRKVAESRDASITRIESAPLDGTLYLLAYRGNEATRLDAQTFASAPVQRSDIERIKSLLAGKYRATVDFLSAGDAYYYSGHDARKLPVYRIALDDANRTRYYIDAATGDVLDKIDPNRRAYRWLFEGLHRFDFVAALRTRPWWDLLVLPLMIGVTVVCFTGVWMAYKRLAPRR
ncbi:MAG TPA: PepSY domain-containing protein [Roseiflexaceae bacterium]|nr:PepSY domain-containing protein [Roseiflexaceae bacterium]